MSEKLDKILADIVAEPHAREFTFERASVNDAERTVSLSFASEEPYQRWFGIEILDHSKKSVDLKRLKRGGALLLNHDTDKQIGVVESCEIDEGKKCSRAVVRFGKSALAEEIFQDVKDGIRSLVSVGYEIQKIEREKVEDGLETYRATRWQPYEISIVSIPADTTVGVGRNKTNNSDSNMRILLDPAPSQGGGGTQLPAPVPAPSVNIQEITNNARNEEVNRIREITALGEQHKSRDEATQFIAEGKSAEAFRKHVLETRYNGAKPLVPAQEKPGIGMSEKDARNFSLTRAINCFVENKRLDGFEKEASDAVATKLGRPAKGFYVPFDTMATPLKRALNSTTATAGGFTVGTDLLGSSMIDLLRNKMVFASLGAQTLGGLQGNVAIPRHTGGATAYWLAEGATVTTSQQTFGQLALTPKRLVARTAYDKQLLLQSSIDVESFIRNDLMAVLALKKDAACINGLGAAGEPLGILNTTGVGSVTFGAAATWAKVVEFETTTNTANALDGRVAYLTTPATKGKWKTAVKVSGQAIFLWENGNLVNGYPAESTNQFPSGDKVIFGNFSDFIIADWEGMDVVVDPYSLAANGQIQIIMTTHTDTGIRHAASFTISSDSGAQ